MSATYWYSCTKGWLYKVKTSDKSKYGYSSFGASNRTADGPIDVNCVRLSIVLCKEWSWQIFAKSSHLGFGILERNCLEVYGLERSDREFLVGSDSWVPFLDFRRLAAFTARMIVTTCILQLTEA